MPHINTFHARLKALVRAEDKYFENTRTTSYHP